MHTQNASFKRAHVLNEFRTKKIYFTFWSSYRSHQQKIYQISAQLHDL